MNDKNTTKTQRSKFLEKAKELECDIDENSFNSALKTISKSQVSDKRVASPKVQKQK